MKKLVSVLLIAFMLFVSAVPAYAAMPDGSLDKIAIPLSEGQVSTFCLPDYHPHLPTHSKVVCGLHHA